MEKEKNILSIGRRIIGIEKEALATLEQSLDHRFSAAVEAVFASKGRLIVSGIGKSALVAQKIVATLNSTGTSSVFLHAADAIHGDIGVICPDDMLLCISKSGQTTELKMLVPMIRRFGNPIIAMTSQADSYLAQQADYCLLTPVDIEADPHNLAPTASTTAQMAMGDALAISLLSLRGFSPDDFAQLHPGGALGKQLFLRVADLCLHHELPRVHPDAHLRQAIFEITSKRLGAVVVMNEQDEILGIITDGDLRRLMERHEQLADLRARDAMSLTPKTIDKYALAVQALQLMKEHSITQLVVEEAGRCCGMLHLHDLVREGIL